MKKEKDNTLLIILIGIIAAVFVMIIIYFAIKLIIVKPKTNGGILFDVEKNLTNNDLIQDILKDAEISTKVEKDELVITIKNNSDETTKKLKLEENYLVYEEDVKAKFDKIIFVSIIDSLMQSQGIEKNKAGFLSNQELELLGIKTNVSDTTIEYRIDTTKKIEPIEYVDYEVLKIFSKSPFTIVRGKVVLVKLPSKDDVDTYLVNEEELTDNSYKTLLSVVKLESSNYEEFIKDYKKLENKTFENIDIDINYELTEEDKEYFTNYGKKTIKIDVKRQK